MNVASPALNLGGVVFPSNNTDKVNPPNLRIALAGSNPDNKKWNLLYDEEYDGLQGLKVFSEITTTEYLEDVQKYGNVAQAKLTMNLFIIKPDMKGNPTQAKSRIVALGNLEKGI